MKKAVQSGAGKTRPVPLMKPGIPNPPPQESPATNISIYQLESHSCRWPVNREGDPYIFCGKRRIADSSYCQEHHLESRSKQSGGKSLKALREQAETQAA